MAEPLVSVCIPYFAAPKLLQRAVGSVFAQVGVPLDRVEVIIASDSSDDESLATLETLRSRYPIRVDQNEQQRGLAANWEHALRSGTGRIRTLLHQDDWYDPNCLETVLRAFERVSDLIMYSPRSLIHDAERTAVHIQKRRLLGEMSAAEFGTRLMKEFECPVPSASFYSGEHLATIEPLYDSRYEFCPEFDLNLRFMRAHPEGRAWNDAAVVIQRGVGVGQYSRFSEGERCRDYCRLFAEHRDLIPFAWLDWNPEKCQFGRVNERLADFLIASVGAPVARFAEAHVAARRLLESDELAAFLDIDERVSRDLSKRIVARLEERPEIPLWEMVDAVSRSRDEKGWAALARPLDRFYASRVAENGSSSETFSKAVRRADSFRRPVLIVGFHHSGTRLLASLLAESGVFQVVDSPTYEWTFVQRLDSILLPEWNSPEAVESFAADGSGLAVSPETIARRLWRHGYDGISAWGIKDPRLVAVVDAWIAAFPKARVVEIVRDPLDVLGTLPAAYRRFTPGDCVPQEAPTFWAELYEASAQRLARSGHKRHDAIRIRFEDLCEDPRATMAPVLDLLELPVSADDLAVDIKPGKVGVHREWLADGRLSAASHRKLVELLSDRRRECGYLDGR